MATKTDKTTFRGLGILDPRFLTSDVLWAAESTYDQAGPRPGVPEPQQVSDFVLKSTGSQTADSSIRVKLQRGGYPGTSGAAAIWRTGPRLPHPVDAPKWRRAPARVTEEREHDRL